MDEFDRSDSSDISPFVEKSGEWSIVDGKLKEDGGNNGLAYCPTKHPVETWTAVANVTLMDLAVGNEYILFVNYDPVGGGFEGIKFVCDNEYTGTLSLVGYGISASKIPYDSGEGSELVISICRNRNAIWGETSSVNAVVFSTIDQQGTPGRHYAGVMNPGENAVYFGRFSYLEHHATNPICDQCVCTCWPENVGGEDVSLPRVVLATVVPTEGEFPEFLDGLTIELEVEYSTLDEIKWYGETYLPSCVTGEGSYLCKMSLYCRAVTPKWELVVEDDNCFGGTVGCELLGITCDPIVLAFGHRHVLIADDTFADIVITVPP